ncbi:MAG: putative cytokinetic ring protein SteA, partial [Actinomycetota bacterium]
MLRRLRGGPEISNGAVGGMARVDQRTKRLIGRLQAGEVAVIDHEDLDRVAAEGLVEAQVGAVLNAAASTSGKYPNLGPLVLTSAGIPLVDSFGPDLFDQVHEGDLVRIEEGRVFIGQELVARGEMVTKEGAERRLDDLKREISSALERFAENTLEYMRTEREILLEAMHLPQTRTELAGRHVLVVVRGYGYKSDLASLRGYIRDFRPIRVG